MTAARLSRSFRSEDVGARVGGDECTVLLPMAGKDVAEAALRRLKEKGR